MMLASLTRTTKSSIYTWRASIDSSNVAKLLKALLKKNSRKRHGLSVCFCHHPQSFHVPLALDWSRARASQPHVHDVTMVFFWKFCWLFERARFAYDDTRTLISAVPCGFASAITSSERFASSERAPTISRHWAERKHCPHNWLPSPPAPATFANRPPVFTDIGFANVTSFGTPEDPDLCAMSG